MAAAQIFNFLPIGLAWGLNLKNEQVIMNVLVSLDTTQSLGFLSTLALVYIPNNMFSTLQLDMHIPTAPIYQNPDASTFSLMQYINPAIPLIPGSGVANGGGSETGGNNPATSSSVSGNGGVFQNTNSDGSSPATSGTTAAIAVASIGGAAAYGAAMFLLARRYKSRKQNHRRSSSLTNPSEMRHSGSPVFGAAIMSGGRTTPGNERNSRGSGGTGNSARTQQISAPMMAENSLGWN